MPAPLDRDRVSRHLQRLDLRELFIGELGWDDGGADLEVTVAGRTFALEAVAHKRGLVAYRYVADSEDAFPDHPIRQKIERAVARSVREHLVVYATSDRNTQCWQWVKREAGRPDRTRTHIYSGGQSGEALIQKLEHLVFTLAEEEDITLVEVSGRVRAAFDVEKVTKRFYDRFKQEHKAYLDFIEGITATADREWYASLMLNRMMFIYFIQKRGFLDGDADYLRNRLERVRRERGHGKFHCFYRVFLLRLFHEGLGRPEADRAPELAALLGRVPYLNGGLFDVHDLERDNADIHIPDDAFERIFAFFEAYQWHLDERPHRATTTRSIPTCSATSSRSTSTRSRWAPTTRRRTSPGTSVTQHGHPVPVRCGREASAPVAFKLRQVECGGSCRDDPDRYIYPSVAARRQPGRMLHRRRAATASTSPENFRRGDRGRPRRCVAVAAAWNQSAPGRSMPCPRRRGASWSPGGCRYEEVRAQACRGRGHGASMISSPYNLDIETFAQRRRRPAARGRNSCELSGTRCVRAISDSGPDLRIGRLPFRRAEHPRTTLRRLPRGDAGLPRGSRSTRGASPHHPEKLCATSETSSNRSGRHPSERYFILKSIVHQQPLRRGYHGGGS